IVAGRSGYDAVADGVKQRVGIELHQSRGDVQSAGLDPLDRGSIHHSSRGVAIAIDAVGPGAEHSNVLPCNFLRAVKRELLIASAHARLRSHLHRDLTTRDEARARYASA